MDLDNSQGGKLLARAGLSLIAANVDSRFRDHILRAGINYTFGGPVIAKY